MVKARKGNVVKVSREALFARISKLEEQVRRMEALHADFLENIKKLTREVSLHHNDVSVLNEKVYKSGQCLTRNGVKRS